jgi:phosphatidylglycerophosphatase A
MSSKSDTPEKSRFYGIRPLPAGTTFNNPNVLIATWFGAGRLKPASGTMGSLAALPFGYALQASVGMLGLAIAALLMLWIGTLAARYYGQKSGQKDDQAIVVDEVVGVWIAGIPAATNPVLWIIAFALFRLFDITKPFPASYFDKSERGGAFYVMMDDVVAGIYAFFGVAALSIVTLF